jgi:hypothetical protein
MSDANHVSKLNIDDLLTRAIQQGNGASRSEIIRRQIERDPKLRLGDFLLGELLRVRQPAERTTNDVVERRHTLHVTSLEELKAELRKLVDDESFKFDRFNNPEQCFSFCDDGINAQVKSLDDMSDRQWKMAEMLLSAYSAHVKLQQRNR